MTETVAVRSTGKVVGPWRAMWLRVEGHWAWYRRHWRSKIYSSGLHPLLFLGAMGLGFGSQVEPGAATGGVEYLHYIAPTLLVSGAMMSAVGDASYPVLSGFKWQRDYIAVTATPITPGQLLGGQLMWVALRLLLSSLVYAVIALLFGAWLNWGALLAVVVAVVTGMACAAPVMAIAGSIYGEGLQFVSLNRFVVLPMTLFAGTFFPISRIAMPLRSLAWVSPLWHGNALARGATLGGLEPLAAAGHAAFLVALFIAGAVVARQRFYRRLVV